MKFLHAGFVVVALAALFAPGLAGCRMALNRSYAARGPSFERSFEAALKALATKGYTIASMDRSTGVITTEKRFKGPHWWLITVSVDRNGEALFRASGSEELQDGPEIHKKLLGYAANVRKAFLADLKRRPDWQPTPIDETDLPPEADEDEGEDEDL